MKTTMVGLTALLMTGTIASAADIYQPAAEDNAFIYDAPEVRVSEANGWYLRGDIGYSLNKIRGVEFYQGAVSSSMTDFTTAKLRNAFTGGFGVGYQANSYLRTDLTFDYMGQANFKGSTTGTCGDGGSPVTQVACTSRDRSKLHVYGLMANAYVDFGTYGRITPYVGGGIGGAYVKWDKLKNTACVDGGSFCNDEDEHGGKGKWRFAYALMAGASFDVTCALKADVGYRFRYINGGDMFKYANNGGPGRDKGLYSHEARVGGRYVFDGCDTAQFIEPADIPLQQAVYK